MAELTTAYVTQRIEELRRDWPLLVADANVGQRLSEEIAGFDQMMREKLCSESAPAQS